MNYDLDFFQKKLEANNSFLGYENKIPQLVVCLLEYAKEFRYNAEYEW